MNHRRRQPRAQLSSMNCRSFLRQQIRGQDHAVPRIVSPSSAVNLALTKGLAATRQFSLSRSDRSWKNRGHLTFTNFLFGLNHLFRFDMSEFQNQESLEVLLGGKLAKRGTLATGPTKRTAARCCSMKLKRLIRGCSMCSCKSSTRPSDDGQRGNAGCSGFYVVFTSNLASSELMTLQHSSFTTMERYVLTRASKPCGPNSTPASTRSSSSTGSPTKPNSKSRKCYSMRSLFPARQRLRTLRFKSGAPVLVRHGFHARLGARPMRDTVENPWATRCFSSPQADSPAGNSRQRSGNLPGSASCGGWNSLSARATCLPPSALALMMQRAIAREC